MDNTLNSSKSLYQINISSLLGSEYVKMFENTTQYLVIQIIIHLMLFFTKPDCYPLFNSDFIIFLLFIIVSFMFYWLVVRKLINFV